MDKKKRQNENQISKDDAEDNEESDDIGEFKRASTEELSTRRIVRVNRSSRPSGVSAPSFPSANVDASKSVSNPFASFQGLTGNAPSTTPSSNPFAGFSGLTPAAPAPAPAAKSTFAGFSFPAATAAAPVVAPSTFPVSDASKIPLAPAPTSNGENEFQKKVKKLNQAFLGWAERQIKENAIAVWKDGVKDYIKYQKSLREKYPNEAKKAEQSLSTVPPASNVLPTIAMSAPMKREEPSATTVRKEVPPATTTAPAKKAEVPSLSFVPTTNTTIAPFPAASFPTSGFTFNVAATDNKNLTMGAAFNFPTTSSSFAFPTSSAISSFGAPPTTSFAVQKEEGEEDGGDDEGEPILEPEKILRNENDKDDILIDVQCKLLGYSKELSEWRDKGKGSFRLTKDPDTSKKRMLVRNTMGKITFNAAFFKNMKIDRHKDSLLFSAFVAADETSKPDFQRFTLKLKADDVEKVKGLLEKCIAEL